LKFVEGKKVRPSAAACGAADDVRGPAAYADLVFDRDVTGVGAGAPVKIVDLQAALSHKQHLPVGDGYEAKRRGEDGGQFPRASARRGGRNAGLSPASGFDGADKTHWRCYGVKSAIRLSRQAPFARLVMISRARSSMPSSTIVETAGRSLRRATSARCKTAIAQPDGFRQGRDGNQRPG
jgi:hypothetical protein